MLPSLKLTNHPLLLKIFFSQKRRNHSVRDTKPLPRPVWQSWRPIDMTLGSWICWLIRWFNICCLKAFWGFDWRSFFFKISEKSHLRFWWLKNMFWSHSWCSGIATSENINWWVSWMQHFILDKAVMPGFFRITCEVKMLDFSWSPGDSIRDPTLIPKVGGHLSNQPFQRLTF